MKQFTITETTAHSYYDESDKPAFKMPCGHLQIKTVTRHGYTDKNDKWHNYRKPKTITLTKQDLINEHCNDCLECKIVEGHAHRKHGTQQQVANLFGLGIDNMQSKATERDYSGKSKPAKNFYSEDGILWHYQTVEAVRTHKGVVISNRECWERGFARCSKPRNVSVRLDLTTISNFSIERRNIEILDTQDEHDATLFRSGDRYFVNASDDRQRYVAELIRPCTTLKEAYESMKPRSVIVAEMLHLEVKRQGELFFIPVNTRYVKVFGKPKITDLRKRTKSECVHVYFQCRKCGLKHQASTYEETEKTVVHPRFSLGIPKNITDEQANCKGSYEDMEKRLRLAFKYSMYPNIIVRDSEGRPLETRHHATRIGYMGNYTVVKGVMRHLEHTSLNLGSQWHVIVKNTVKRAVSVGRGAD